MTEPAQQPANGNDSIGPNIATDPVRVIVWYDYI